MYYCILACISKGALYIVYRAPYFFAGGGLKEHVCVSVSDEKEERL